MKTCGTCLIEKRVIDFGPHKTAADGRNPKCKSCVSEYNREYRKKNRNRIIENDLRYAANHREEARKRAIQWRRDNPERTKEKDRRYYQNNRERELEHSKQRHIKNAEANKQRSQQWRKDNPDRVNAQVAKRRADKIQATPKWANLKSIEHLYALAVMLTEINEVSYQVDHVVPLNSDLVCGLHCEDNLRVITAEENNTKKNKLIETLL